ncbi:MULTISPECIES: lactate dehydrogenase [Sphingobacterium]|uniref:D-lactate dehydrogenase n=2 Tax=Sphingobacterium TaxID=28453 RepID=A0A420B8B5_SPHD1|nr:MULTISPECIES: lactate dehydrogenase [Sphingobacterium]MCS4228916.1 D-lactate dehydrogenase [Sphingobacterium sp. BIGb0165]RKE53004.1 D-lactate dehydrogenase [Sphingobacterium detergens]
MKVVVYNVRSFEKEFWALANAKQHDLTLISNGLNAETQNYARGKDAIVISGGDILDDKMLLNLKELGINKIMTRSKETSHIDLVKAGALSIQIANAPFEDQSPKGLAEQTVRNLNLWGMEKCVGKACCCLNDCAKNNFQ